MAGPLMGQSMQKGCGQMCLLVLAYHCRADYPMILMANRDEFFDRPTRPLDFWSERKDILAGRDLQAGGTWMGLNRDGRLAAITNFRDPDRLQPDAPSRGHLVSDFIGGDDEAASYLEKLKRKGRCYNGFNLIAGRMEALFYFGNRGPAPRPLEAGIHGLSNHLLNTPWPKVVRAKQAMASIVEHTVRPDPEDLLALLHDRHQPSDKELPETGVGLKGERLLAPVFIHSPVYGTRSSSVLLVAADGRTQFVERTFDPDGRSETRQFELQMPV
jgi:uncharacterized protein with NRDE domain